MSISIVKEYFKEFHKDHEIQEFDSSSATVELAAAALQVEPARIAKTLSFHGMEENSCILVVTAGDVKIDNSKFKHFFGLKARMLNSEEVSVLTGHAVGGVCPFVNPPEAATYLDVSLQRFHTVFPACGSANSAIELTCQDLWQYSKAIQWVDVCKTKDLNA